jgi:hypothetical protein
MSFIKKFNLVLKEPGILVRYKSFLIRKIYFILSKYLHFKTFISRKTKINNKTSLYLNGFEKIDVNQLNENNLNIDSLILEIENKLKNSTYTNQIGQIKAFDLPDIFDTNSQTFNFLTNKYLINTVSNYLGCIPLLTYSSIWYSENQESLKGSPQEYHLDHEDYIQVKGFLYLEDIDENNGAMNLFSKEISNKVAKNLNYNTSPDRKRVGDEVFSEYENEKVICNGKKGTLYLVDTSKCFHCGARKSLNSRLLLTFQFITPWANYLSWNWKKSKVLKKNKWQIQNLNEIQKKVIGIN